MNLELLPLRRHGRANAFRRDHIRRRRRRYPCRRTLRLRDSRRHQHRAEKQGSGEIVGRTGKMKRVSRIDKPSIGPRKQARANQKRDRAQTAERSLQFALLPFAHPPRHDSLRRRHRNVPERNDRDGTEKEQAASRQSGHDHSTRAEKLSGVKGSSFAETFNHERSKAARDGGGANTDDGQRETHHTLAPAVTIDRVEGPDAEYIVREVSEELN